MPLPNPKTTPEALDISCTDVLWLYSVIEKVTQKAHDTHMLTPRWSIESMRQKVWYFAYTDTNLAITWEAIELWKSFRRESLMSLPICLEDELAIIFYIFIYHEKPEIKKNAIVSILRWLWIKDIPKEILILCQEPPIAREINTDL
jgi:hypothetical protein